MRVVVVGWGGVGRRRAGLDATGDDGWRAVQMAYAVYQASASGRTVKL